MRNYRRASLWAALVAVVLAGCEGQLPRPIIERSVLPAPARLYLPVIAKQRAQPAGKLGMAGCPASCEAFGCSWCYSWAPQPGNTPDTESVPMIWNEKDLLAEPGGDSRWMMGFNEPDLCPRQACLSPEQAVVLWELIERRFPDRKLVAPAPSDQNIDWLPAFREAFKARYDRYPRFDALAVHCYANDARMCISLVTHFENWAKAWGVGQLWVTEFHFTREQEARAFVAFLEAHPMVTHYAPFVSVSDCDSKLYWNCDFGGDPALLTEDGQLTAKGRWYARPRASEPEQ